MSASVKSRRPSRRSRAAWVVDVERLRAKGLTGLEIARKLGISSGFVYSLFRDPTGELDHRRKRKYDGICARCGGRTSGTDGRPRELCTSCMRKRQHEDRYWTREQILEAFRDFHRRTGRVPRAGDYLALFPSQRHRFSPERLAEIEEDQGVNPTVVRREFGSWRAALAEAGFALSKGGAPTHRRKRVSAAARETLVLLLDRPTSIPEIAAARSVNYTAAHFTIRSLFSRGLVAVERPHRIVGGGHGSIPALYRITDAGREILLERG